VGQSFHFAVGSDAHFGAGTNNPGQTKAMLNQISNPANKYDAFFFLGDLVEYGFVDSHWKEALDTFSPTVLNVPTHFVAGNHDTLFGGLSRYKDYCGPPKTELQNGSKLWYRVDAGNVHFMVLDVEWSAETFTEEQGNWLEIQLSSIPDGDWKIIMSHGFYYSSGISSSGWNWFDNPETISRIASLFEKYNVDMVFSGHNHCLEILQHAGIYYVVCGGFGGKFDPVPTYISSSSIWLQPGQSGFTDVNISGDLATLNFRDPNSKVLKNLSLTKN
jgi:acid phosphatase type 7